MRFATKREEENFRIGITPLIDIVFLLLIFFMLTSHFDVASGVRIRLPKVTQKVYEREENKITVVLDEKGRTYLKGRKVGDKMLVAKLRDLVKKRGVSDLVLHADKETKHGRVVQVMDLAKTAGIRTILIAARWNVKKAP